jgi:arsenate reductase-like glutaredoxin family protein
VARFGRASGLPLARSRPGAHALREGGRPAEVGASILSAMPVPAGPTVQMFGLADSRPTQAALRFFKERRVNVTFVDLRRKPIAAGELRRFVERLGAAALLDTDGRRYKELGLGYMRLGDDEIVERLLADDGLLRLPLVRFGNAFTAGPADATWKAWLAGTAK